MYILSLRAFMFNSSGRGFVAFVYLFCFVQCVNMSLLWCHEMYHVTHICSATVPRAHPHLCSVTTPRALLHFCSVTVPRVSLHLRFVTAPGARLHLCFVTAPVHVSTFALWQFHVNVSTFALWQLNVHVSTFALWQLHVHVLLIITGVHSSTFLQLKSLLRAFICMPRSLRQRVTSFGKCLAYCWYFSAFEMTIVIMAA